MKRLTPKELKEKEGRIEDILFRAIDGQLTEMEIEYVVEETKNNMHAEGMYFISDSFEMDGDIRHELLHLNNFKLMAIIGYIIKYKMSNAEQLSSLKIVLSKMSVYIEKYGFYGHGFDAFEDRTESYNLIKNIGLSKLFEELLPITLGAFNELKKLEKYLQEGYISDWSGKKVEKEYLFVYGTLLRKAKNSKKLMTAEYVGEGVINDFALYNVNDIYPGIRKKEGYKVYGEIYAVYWDQLNSIDSFEGSQYKREKVSTYKVPEMDMYNCHTYVMKEDVQILGTIKEGVWEEKLVNYFAYGSCLNENDFKEYIFDMGYKANYRILGIATIENHKLAFTYRSRGRDGGVLDIVNRDDDNVLGIVYQMPFSLLKKVIDRREGHPNTYKREIMLAKLNNGQMIPIYTYKVTKQKRKMNGVKPNIDYLNIVYEGMKQFNLPKNYIYRFLGEISEKYHMNIGEK